MTESNQIWTGEDLYESMSTLATVCPWLRPVSKLAVIVFWQLLLITKTFVIMVIKETKQ
jgi:hypothetical protein